MVWRKWVVRGLVIGILGGLVLAGLLYQYWTHPEAIRRQVLNRLENDFVDVHASIESARLRLFGGIAVQELRLARSGDLDKSDFLYVPSALLYHDKELLLRKKLSIRKIDLQRPRLRVVRERDGRWNLDGLLGPTSPDQRLPTLVVQQGTLVVEDRRAPAGTPPLEIKNVYLNAVNDPLPVVVFEGGGVCEGAGAVRIRGRAQRAGGAITLRIEAPQMTAGPDLVQRLSGYAPDLAVHARQLAGTLRLAATLTWDRRASPPFSYAVHGEFEDAYFAHARLPWPVEALRGSFDFAAGVLTRAELHGKAGQTELDLTVSDLDPARWSTSTWAEAVREFDVRARHLTINDELYAYLPAAAQEYRTEYAPAGLATVRLDYRRLAPGRYRKHWTFEGEGGTALYHLFRYPVRDLRGTANLVSTGRSADGPDAEEHELTLDMNALAGGRRIYLKGKVEGTKRTAGINVDLWGDDLTLDEQALAALPERSGRLARSFRPSGRFDFKVFLRRTRGRREMANRFLFHFHDATACYKVFPLPLTDVSGTLDIQPDHWEFRDCVGRYGGGIVRAAGRSHPLPGPRRSLVATRITTPYAIRNVSYQPDPPAPPGPRSPAAAPQRAERVSLTITGEDLPLDEGFRAALAPGREALAKAFDTFALTGTMSFTARIDDLPDRAQDIDVTVGVAGCRMRPEFFTYPLEDVAATVRYHRDAVHLAGFRGRHGTSQVSIDRGTVLLKPAGGFWARLDRLAARPLVPDDDLRRALPAPLANAVKTLALRDPVELDALLVIDQSAEPRARPVVYWDGTAKLKNASLKTGVDWEGVTGAVSVRGRHGGEKLEDVVGNVYLEQARVLNQPLEKVHIPLAVWKSSPDILRLPDLKAGFFGGTLGGEGRIEFGSIFRYEMLLQASQVQLEQFGRHNFGSRAELSGQATAALHLTGEGTDLEGVKGNGRLDVPVGKMYRLPLLLDLLKWLGLGRADRTAFDQALARFRIDGPRMHVTQLELYGRAVSLRGQGSMNLDGTDLNVDLNADWGRLPQLLPPGLSDVSRGLNDQLLRIMVRGSLADVRFEKEFVPLVTDPLKKLFGAAPEPRADARAAGAKDDESVILARSASDGFFTRRWRSGLVMKPLRERGPECLAASCFG